MKFLFLSSLVTSEGHFRNFTTYHLTLSRRSCLPGARNHCFISVKLDSFPWQRSVDVKSKCNFSLSSRTGRSRACQLSLATKCKSHKQVIFSLCLFRQARTKVSESVSSHTLARRSAQFRCTDVSVDELFCVGFCEHDGFCFFPFLGGVTAANVNISPDAASIRRACHESWAFCHGTSSNQQWTLSHWSWSDAFPAEAHDGDTKRSTLGIPIELSRGIVGTHSTPGKRCWAQAYCSLKLENRLTWTPWNQIISEKKHMELL